MIKEYKPIDLLIAMGYTSSAGVARDLIIGGALKVDGEVVLDHRSLLTVSASTVVDVDKQLSLVGDRHPAFLGAKFGLSETP